MRIKDWTLSGFFSLLFYYPRVFTRGYSYSSHYRGIDCPKDNNVNNPVQNSGLVKKLKKQPRSGLKLSELLITNIIQPLIRIIYEL